MKIFRILTLLLFVLSFNDLVYCNEPVIRKSEILNFKIRYGFITAGEVSFDTRETYFSGKKVFHTQVVAKTTGLIDQLYRLHDVFESYYDREIRQPCFSITNLSEGKYRYYNENTYDQENFTVYSQRKDSTFQLKSQVFDVVSAIYHFRTLDWNNLAVNDMIELQTFHQDDAAPMYVVYKGLEDISIGTFIYRCHKFAPIIDSGKIFQKKENMIILFSADKNKIPVSIKLNLLVGAFRLELDSYEGLIHSFDAKIK